MKEQMHAHETAIPPTIPNLRMSITYLFIILG
jgi:hypothetical protein